MITMCVHMDKSVASVSHFSGVLYEYLRMCALVDGEF